MKNLLILVIILNLFSCDYLQEKPKNYSTQTCVFIDPETYRTDTVIINIDVSKYTKQEFISVYMENYNKWLLDIRKEPESIKQVNKYETYNFSLYVNGNFL